MKDFLKDLNKRRHNALQMGGPQKIRRQYEKGRLTARERIAKLLDPGSFMEMGLLAHSAIPEMADRTPADGLICGYGLINKRRVAVIANDFTVLASTNARTNLKKALQFKEQVKERIHVPLIWLGESGGARMPDCQGSKEFYSLTGGGVSTLMPAYTHFRKQPFIFAAMGECYGVPDFQACLADFVVMVKGSSVAVSGPRALERAIGENYTGEETGGWTIHSRITGMADNVAENDEECLKIIKEYLDFVPDNNSRRPSRRKSPDESGGGREEILQVFPENRNLIYDMRKVIACITDRGKTFELKPDFGQMLITCLARVDGEVVGFAANNPMNNVGAMDTDGLDKLVSFLCLCDSYNIPLIFLHDTPGHMVGKEAERKRVGAKVVNAHQALFQVTVPKISIILRKSYGKAAINMCGPGAGPDFIVAWPTAEIGFMDPQIASDVVFGHLSEEDRKQAVEKMMGDLSPYPAAGAYYLQDIIDPRDTRKYITDVLRTIRDSKNKGIGEHRLANWPTKF